MKVKHTLKYGGKIIAAAELVGKEWVPVNAETLASLETIFKSGEGVFRSDRSARYDICADDGETLTFRELWPFVQIGDKVAINQTYVDAEFELVVIAIADKTTGLPVDSRIYYAITRRPFNTWKVNLPLPVNHEEGT